MQGALLLVIVEERPAYFMDPLATVVVLVDKAIIKVCVALALLPIEKLVSLVEELTVLVTKFRVVHDCGRRR